MPDRALKNQNPVPDRAWLLDQLSSRNLTQRQLAERLSVDPATVSYILSGKRPLKLDELYQLSEMFELPTGEIMQRWGYEVRREVAKVPLRYHLRDDCKLLLPKHKTTVTRPPSVPADGFAVQIRTDTGPGHLWNGMLAYFAGGARPAVDSLGTLACITTTDDKQVMGVLTKGYEPCRFNLTHPASGHRCEDVEVACATPVLWMRAA